VRLLNRTTRAVSPTEAGQAYFDRLRPLLDEFDSLDAAVRDVTQVPRGRLRLTAPLDLRRAGTDPDPERLCPALARDRAGRELFRPGGEPGGRGFRHGDPRRSAGGFQHDRAQALRGAHHHRGRAGLAGRARRAGGPAGVAAHRCILDTNFREPERWPFRVDGKSVAMPVRGVCAIPTPKPAERGRGRAGLGLRAQLRRG
jgi:hypothetical protein